LNANQSLERRKPQSTKRGFLAVSVGVLERWIAIQGSVEVLPLPLAFLVMSDVRHVRRYVEIPNRTPPTHHHREETCNEVRKSKLEACDYVENAENKPGLSLKNFTI